MKLPTKAGSTGTMMPMASMSMSTVTMMKAMAGCRPDDDVVTGCGNDAAGAATEWEASDKNHLTPSGSWGLLW